MCFPELFGGLYFLVIWPWVFPNDVVRLAKTILFEAGIPKDTSDYNYPHKERWFHLLVVSRGLSDSQHSLRCYYPRFLRGTGRFHGHLNFRATSSFTFLETCIGRPDTKQLYRAYLIFTTLSGWQPCAYRRPSSHHSSQHLFHSLSPRTCWCWQSTGTSQAITFIMGQIKHFLPGEKMYSHITKSRSVLSMVFQSISSLMVLFQPI